MIPPPPPASAPARLPAAAVDASQPARGVTRDGIPLDSLRFNSVDVRRLRAYLGEGEVYQQFKDRFDTADLAWFIAGAHKDGAHFLPPDRFHKQWQNARIAQGNDPQVLYNARRDFRDRLRDLVWDAITMLDRVSGGASFLVHCPGTIEPGHRHELPFLKLDVYVPPFLFYEYPLIERPLASMIQTFAEEVALPVTRRWRRAFENTGHTLPQSRSAEVPEPPSNLPFMPEPQYRSTMYRCRGRRVGELQEMLANADDGAPTDRDGPARREGHTRRASSRSEEIEAYRLEIAQLLSTVEELEPFRLEVAHLLTVVDEKDAEIARLSTIIKDRDVDILRLQEELDASPHAGRGTPGIDHAALAAPTPTPSRASVASPLRAAISLPSPAPIMPDTPRSASSHRVRPMAPTSPASPLASRLSSMSISSWSVADLSSTSPPSPSPSHLAPSTPLEWQMPSPSRQSPVAIASPRSGPSRAPVLTRFDVIGPSTQAVLEASNLPSSLHRTLRDLVLMHPQSAWACILQNEFLLGEQTTRALLSALESDIPMA